MMRPLMRRMQLRAAGLALLSLLSLPSLLSCVTYREKRLREFTSASLMGVVFDAEQKPCVGALVTVDGREGPRTDINGRFLIESLTRGDHRIGVQKDGYESLETQVSFLQRTQVLYLSVVSQGQLLSEAEEALDRQKLADADDLLRRAEALNSEDPVGLYLRAVYFTKQDQPEQAVLLLEKILQPNRRQPAVLLTLADIYQYRIKDIRKAEAFLREYLALDNNPEVRARLGSLEAQSPEAPTTP